MPPPPLARRTLRSGREFSAFDLALGVDFDIEQRLRDTLAAQQSTGHMHEPEDEISLSFFEPQSSSESPSHSQPSPDAVMDNEFTASSSTSSSVPSLSLDPSLSAQDRNKKKSHARRAKRREDARIAAQNPMLKSVHKKRVEEAKPSCVEVEYDTNGLPHTLPAWIGSRSAEGDSFVFTEPTTIHSGDTGMGGRVYSQAEVDALTGTLGFTYIAWLGLLTIAILDSRRRVIAVLGGTPKDTEDWAKVTEGASSSLQERLGKLKLSEEKLNHRRAQEPFAAVSRGPSHGGGQTEPGELQQNVTNTRLTDELMAGDYFPRIVGFTTVLFFIWAPKLAALYQSTRAALQAWRPQMRWNFPTAKSVFAACTFNFGPHAITRPHLDYGNLAWGWCAVTALGWFDPDFGGHLILWDLKLVIRFPPGSSILIPSALIRHSNVPVRSHEIRSSFTQYTAGGLFRWVRNGFRTDEDFESSASPEEKAARAAEATTRWEEGMNMFSVVDDL